MYHWPLLSYFMGCNFQRDHALSFISYEMFGVIFYIVFKMKVFSSLFDPRVALAQLLVFIFPF